MVFKLGGKVGHVTRHARQLLKVKGQTITFLEFPTRFAYSLYNFSWATTTIKGRLLSSRPM